MADDISIAEICGGGPQQTSTPERRIPCKVLFGETSVEAKKSKLIEVLLGETPPEAKKRKLIDDNKIDQTPQSDKYCSPGEQFRD